MEGRCLQRGLQHYRHMCNCVYVEWDGMEGGQVFREARDLQHYRHMCNCVEWDEMESRCLGRGLQHSRHMCNSVTSWNGTTLHQAGFNNLRKKQKKKKWGPAMCWGRGVNRYQLFLGLVA